MKSMILHWPRSTCTIEKSTKWRIIWENCCRPSLNGDCTLRRKEEFSDNSICIYFIVYRFWTNAVEDICIYALSASKARIIYGCADLAYLRWIPETIPFRRCLRHIRRNCTPLHTWLREAKTLFNEYLS